MQFLLCAAHESAYHACVISILNGGWLFLGIWWQSFYLLLIKNAFMILNMLKGNWNATSLDYAAWMLVLSHDPPWQRFPIISHVILINFHEISHYFLFFAPFSRIPCKSHRKWLCSRTITCTKIGWKESWEIKENHTPRTANVYPMHFSRPTIMYNIVTMANARYSLKVFSDQTFGWHWLADIVPISDLTKTIFLRLPAADSCHSWFPSDFWIGTITITFTSLQRLLSRGNLCALCNTRQSIKQSNTHACPLGTRRFCDAEATSLTLIQRRNNVVCSVGSRPSTNVELVSVDGYPALIQHWPAFAWYVILKTTAQVFTIGAKPLFVFTRVQSPGVNAVKSPTW